MRAAVLWERGGELEVRDDVELRELGPQDVRVRLAASGVCHTDVSVQAGTLAAEIPCVPGHEGAGTVTAVGPEVEGIRAGDPVILAAATGCLRCPSCLRGQTHLCRKGMGSWGPPADGSPAPFYSAGVNLPGYVGTFAEEIVVPQDCAVKIEPDVPLDVVALIGCCVVTGVGAALNTARIEPGSTVAVFGCGGIGSAAIQGARIAGAAEIVAVDPVEAKLETAAHFGATRAVAPGGIDGVKRELTGGVGFDYALECAGHASVVRQAYDAIRPGGTLVLVGVGDPEDRLPLSPTELVIEAKTLKGSLYGDANARRDFARLIHWWRNGQLDLEGLISRRWRLDEINQAFRALEAGEVVRSLIELE
ncbi:MAG: Zn-dependent alcohol dehydrogenase [Proteobacteria bacterium]|nr:Zn-dependent alcohol dehydrogenase [Pseudomonadota bacterium]